MVSGNHQGWMQGDLPGSKNRELDMVGTMDFSLRTCFIGKLYCRLLERYVLPQLDRYGFSPNQLTVLGLALAALVPLGFYVHPAAGLFFLLCSGIADSIDGLLSRFQDNVSPFGAFLDSSFDRLSDFFYLMGFWVLFWPSTHQLSATVFILMGVSFTGLISYVKARAEALGIGCRAGGMERGIRIIYLLLWALSIVMWGRLSVVLWSGLLLYVGLTAWTAAFRVFHIRSRMVFPNSPRE